jgi:hypothetical protein
MHVGRCFLALDNHTLRLFVPKRDFASTIGRGQGGTDAWARLALPGGGPKYFVTPLCVMDFTAAERRMRLASAPPA